MNNAEINCVGHVISSSNSLSLPVRYHFSIRRKLYAAVPHGSYTATPSKPHAVAGPHALLPSWLSCCPFGLAVVKAQSNTMASIPTKSPVLGGGGDGRHRKGHAGRACEGVFLHLPD